MSTKSKPEDNDDDLEEDLETFEEMPEKTKDLMKLKKEDEKTTGAEQVEITEEIEEKTNKPQH